MAESLSAIRQRLDSVTQTRQITNAMYLLSASRYKHSLAGMDYTLRYMERLRLDMREILFVTKGAGIHNIYLDKSPKGTALFMSVMGDKGLCGSYNSAVAALTAEKLKTKKDPRLVCFGRIGSEYLTRRGIVPDNVLPGSSMHPDLLLAEDLAKRLIDAYLTDEVNEVYIIYTPYGKGARRPVCLRMLPLMRHDFLDAVTPRLPTEMLYEPSAEKVFEHIVPLYCAGLIYNILIQSAACENAARMDAMQSATENADEMIHTLQMKLNSVRQQNITAEITEIAAASTLLKKGI